MLPPDAENIGTSLSAPSGILALMSPLFRAVKLSCRKMSLDGYQFLNFYSSSSNHRLDITLLRLQRHCLVPRRRHPGCESTHCEGK
ncbi:hypothetical protein J6590_000483 [Homalodisca vitripennis]|nr:hypothetical protein J6590_000483 [Homalodisca vitripennis]